MEPKQPAQEYSYNNFSQNTEIDLLQVLQKLWQQRLIIIGIIGVFTLFGLFYALMATPIYQARAQLQIPTIAELAPLNKSEFYRVTPEIVFKNFLTELESDSHKAAFIDNNEKHISSVLGIKIDDNIKKNLTKVRNINYPSERRNNNIIFPDSYTITLIGHNRDELGPLLDRDIQTAALATTQQLIRDFQHIRETEIDKRKQDITTLTSMLKEKRDNTIIQLQEKHQLQMLELQDQLSARKAYVLNSRRDRIEELKQAISIAKQLNIEEPITLSRLSPTGGGSQVEINADINGKKEPLYLKGTRLLSAELENITSLSKNLFLDDEVNRLEAELSKLASNREVEVLKARKNDEAFSSELQKNKEELAYLQRQTVDDDLSISFQNNPSNVPKDPIKPKKRIIVVVAFIIGLFSAFLVAICLMLLGKRPLVSVAE